jgi:hypothetical protein
MPQHREPKGGEAPERHVMQRRELEHGPFDLSAGRIVQPMSVG